MSDFNNPSITTLDELTERLQRMRNSSRTQPVANLALRVDRLRRLEALLVTHQHALTKAIDDDFGGRSHRQSRLTDIVGSLAAIRNAIEHVPQWMETTEVTSEFAGMSSAIYRQPLGVIGIISPWNFPLVLALAPLAGVLAAGNRALIKPSELTPSTSELLGKLISEYFDADELAVVVGDAQMGADFSSQSFDHLIFTGGASVARHIMRAASENLVPLTLELGGKSPVIVSRTADIQQFAERVMTVKTFNAGQICLSPDYLLVPEEKLDIVVEALAQAVAKMYPILIDNQDYTSIINARHFSRVAGLLEDATKLGATIIPLNNPSEPAFDIARHRMVPTLILNTKPEMRVRSEEIFGPLLPILTYRTLDDAIDLINNGDRPLAAYLFSNDPEEQQQVRDRTTSGALVINDVMTHVLAENLPFGGVGISGMGAYHGRFGYDAFSHAKPVVIQSTQGESNLPMRAPYGPQLDAILDQLVGVAG